jgi:hypothetical protein
MDHLFDVHAGGFWQERLQSGLKIFSLVLDFRRRSRSAQSRAWVWWAPFPARTGAAEPARNMEADGAGCPPTSHKEAERWGGVWWKQTDRERQPNKAKHGGWAQPLFLTSISGRCPSQILGCARHYFSHMRHSLLVTHDPVGRVETFLDSAPRPLTRRLSRQAHQGVGVQAQKPHGAYLSSVQIPSRNSVYSFRLQLVIVSPFMSNTGQVGRRR